MQTVQLRVANILNSVTYATKLESVGKKLLEAYSVFLRSWAEKREEEKWKTVDRYGRKWMIMCKIKQTQGRLHFLMAGVQTSTASCSCRPKPSGMRVSTPGTVPWTLYQVLWRKVWCWRVEQRWTELRSNTKWSEEEQLVGLYCNSSNI